jgi:2-C-methyl-D-erythritol 4-phosphate cytidylyltransferase
MKKKKVYAILTAAGVGERFKKLSKDSNPKQFLNLLGKPVILHSLLALEKSKLIDEIIISSNKKYFDMLHSLAQKYKIKKLSQLTEGGKTRFESVKNAFKQINGAKDDLVLIHDAVRPNISTVLVDKIIANAKKHGEVIIGTRVIETVKRDKNSYVKKTIDRSNLWTVQTPQVFRYKILKNAYKKARRKKDFTDESSLVENAGYRVMISEGSTDNIKITSPRDITLLKKLMS